MKITYNNTDIDFFNFELPKELFVSLSGGLDSASAMYLVCKHFPEIEIIPFTARDVNAPFDAEAAEDIVFWFQKEFPNITIKDIQIFDFNDQDESFVSNTIVDNEIKNDKEFYGMNRVQVSKMIQIEDIKNQMIEGTLNAMILDGITLNPPIEDMKRVGFYEKAERRRDPGHIPKVVLKPVMYKPFKNVDKKFIADIYKGNNLMDSLYTLTRSCVGTAKDTNYFLHECGECFWCLEKKWAFA